MDDRFKFYPPQKQAVAYAHQVTREEFSKLVSLLERLVPEGHSRSVAITNLETACMWTNKGIAENSDKFPDDEPT